MPGDKTLKDLLCLLVDSQIPLVVVGGYAARMHGTSLLTDDIDLCIPLTPETITGLRALLAPFHPVHRMSPKDLPFSEYPKELSSIKNLYIRTDLGIIDFLGEVGGVGNYDRVLQNAAEVLIFGRKCRVISIDDLITAKLFMKRAHDLETVKQLEWIKANLGLK